MKQFAVDLWAFVRSLDLISASVGAAVGIVIALVFM